MVFIEFKMGIVFSNLIDNGIHYSKEGSGQVVVRLRELAGSSVAEVVVEDTGVGISSEDQPKLFTKFFRAESAKKSNVTGTGLGLHIVRNIVLRHGGDISVQSILGKGSAFRFTVPLA